MVDCLQHALRILDIRSGNVVLLLFDHEPDFRHQRHYLIVRQFETARIGDTRRVLGVVLAIAVVVVAVVTWRVVLEMPEQWAEIDKNAARFEALF